MSHAVIDQTTIHSEIDGHHFRSTGSIIKFPGFRTVYLETAAEKAIKMFLNQRTQFFLRYQKVKVLSFQSLLRNKSIGHHHHQDLMKHLSLSH